MNSRYEVGDYEARHNDPAWRDQANFVICADISSDPSKGEWEQLWATQISDNYFRICCIPFFTYGISLGDVVEADKDYIVRDVIFAS